MYSRCLSLLFSAALIMQAGTLRVCADPDNLPFSNRAQAGFENRLAQMVAHDLNASLEYAWWPGRAHSLDRSLKAGACDLLFGVPDGMEGLLLTRPYYKSSYVFVSRADRGSAFSSLMDARLAQSKIGVSVVGDDYAPPAVLLARRGLAANVVPFRLFGPRGETNAQARIVDAVRRGDIDVAIVWGPVAGYFARRASQDAPLQIDAISPPEFAGIPFTYSVSAALRQDETALRKEVDQVLARECRSIQALLTQYRVPLVAEDQSRCDTQLSPVLSR